MTWKNMVGNIIPPWKYPTPISGILNNEYVFHLVFQITNYCYMLEIKKNAYLQLSL